MQALLRHVAITVLFCLSASGAVAQTSQKPASPDNAVPGTNRSVDLAGGGGSFSYSQRRKEIDVKEEKAPGVRAIKKVAPVKQVEEEKEKSDRPDTNQAEKPLKPQDVENAEDQPARETDLANTEKEPEQDDEPDLDPVATIKPEKPESVSNADDGATETPGVKTPASDNPSLANLQEEKEEETAEKPPLTLDEKIVQDVISALNRSGSGLRGLNKKEIGALKAYYSQPGQSPHWVSLEGWTRAADKVTAELSRADDYGLKSSTFKRPEIQTASLEEEKIRQSLSKAELSMSRSVLLYARYARGGRLSPGRLRLQRGEQDHTLPPETVIDKLTKTENPAEFLRSLHPKHAQFLKLKEKLAELRHGKDGKKRQPIPAGPVLKPGMSHPQVALLRKRLDVDSVSETDVESFDETVTNAVKAYQKKNGLKADGIVGASTRRHLNGRNNNRLINKVLINMERWRWLPDQLEGDAGIYVWANIPEFRVRVRKPDETLFSERAIVGLVTHKTPVFSDLMEWIEIHPTWFVPNSIKVADILPSLKRPTSTVMERYNLKINCGALGSNPKAIDWSNADITKCSITQPPGRKSVLGDFKFKFPNKHSVYMHDTHKPGLFNTATRTYSHGCVRIKNPRRMAEVLLDHEKIMTSEELGRILRGPKRLHNAKFEKPVPVHITYFTAVFDDEGNFVSRPDYYGHDRQLSAVLNGKASVLTSSIAKKPKKKKAKKKAENKSNNWWDDLFGANQ